MTARRLDRTALAVAILALCVAGSPGAQAVEHPPRIESSTTVAPLIMTADATANATANATAGAADRLLRVAVYDLVVGGDVAPRVGRIVTDAFVAELRKREGLSVVGLDEVRALVAHEAERQRAGCADDGCIAEIADALGADVLVAGGLSTIGDERVLALRRLTTDDATAAAAATLRLRPRGGEEFLAAVGPVVDQLFSDHPLRPGERAGVDPRLALRLNPPPIPAWATLSVGGAAATALAMAAVTGVGLSSTQTAYGKLGDEAVAAGAAGFPGAELAAVRDAGAGWVTATNALLATATVLGTGAAVLAGWTNWSVLTDGEP
jgi:hypothetical protein